MKPYPFTFDTFPLHPFTFDTFPTNLSKVAILRDNVQAEKNQCEC